MSKKIIRRILISVFFVAVWSAIVFYMVEAASYHKQRRSQVVCNKVIVEVRDSAQRAFLSSQVVGELLFEHGFATRGVKRDKIDIYGIETFLRDVMYVKDVNVYINMQGDLHIELEQRRPVVRFITQGGYDFYVSDDHHVLPISNDYVEYVPVVSGTIDFPFDSDYTGPLPLNLNENGKKKLGENNYFLGNLINFVRYIEKDKFWDTQIVQINVAKEGESVEPTIEIVPRIGSHTILLGHIDDYQTKMEKMRDCYMHGMDTTMWNKFSQLDIRYSGQIVGIEKGK